MHYSVHNMCEMKVKGLSFWESTFFFRLKWVFEFCFVSTQVSTRTLCLQKWNPQPHEVRSQAHIKGELQYNFGAQALHGRGYIVAKFGLQCTPFECCKAIIYSPFQIWQIYKEVYLDCSNKRPAIFYCVCPEFFDIICKIK